MAEEGQGSGDPQHVTEQDHKDSSANSRNGPKYVLVIEGEEFPWDRDSIRTEEIAQLGGWDGSQRVIEVDDQNVERTLAPSEVVHIKPGHGFGKKHKWKRGRMRPRIEQELALLRECYPDIQHIEQDGEDWFLIPRFAFPDGWFRGQEAFELAALVFQIKADFPGTTPYGFLIPADLNFRGALPNNACDPPKSPPFAGSWRHLSWSVDEWSANADPRKGSNLLAWCRSFSHRLQEGA